MRKITSSIRAAFNGGVARTIGNTRTDGKAVFLYGNRIIERREDGVYFNLCGWGTPTTRERINGILNAGLHQRNFSTMRNGVEIAECGWHKL